MGAVDFLPYAYSKSQAPVAVWNGSHGIVDHTTGSNVTCELRRPNGLWYKLSTQADIDAGDPSPGPTSASGRYFNADLMNFNPGPPGYVWGPCPPNGDQPGLALRDRAVLVTSAAAALAAFLAARAIIRRRRAGRRLPLDD